MQESLSVMEKSEEEIILVTDGGYVATAGHRIGLKSAVYAGMAQAQCCYEIMKDPSVIEPWRADWAAQVASEINLKPLMPGELKWGNMDKIIQNCLNETFRIEAECLVHAADYINEDAFAQAVELLAGAVRIGAAGCGHSGIACQHFAHLMCCIERPARFISPAEAIHGATGYLQEGDVMVFASRGGKTAELLPILDICKAKKVKVITVTENVESPLAKGADVILRQYVNRETDKYNSQGTTSTTSLCVIFHALQAALIEVTGYRNEQFALIHPGGAVGERLNKH